MLWFVVFGAWWGRRRFSHVLAWPEVLAVVAAGLLRLAYPECDIWPVAYVSLVPLFFGLSGGSRRRVIRVAFLFGLVFWVLTVSWLRHVTAPGMVVLSAYLAMYAVIFGLGVAWAFARLETVARFVFIPSLWMALEYARSHIFSGFPWGILASSQTRALGVIQAADLFGAWGVSFFIVFVNLFFYEVFVRRSLRGWQCVWPLGVVALWLGYGAYRLNEDPGVRGDGLRVALVQGNIPQSVKWQPYFSQDIFDIYAQMTASADRDSSAPVDLVIWPETSFPEDWRAEGAAGSLEYLSRQQKADLLAGVVRVEQDRYFNSAVLFRGGHAVEVYDKIHLVPFGEFLPARRMWPWLGDLLGIGDFSKGQRWTVFWVFASQADVEEKEIFGIGSLICFEDIFSGISREFVRRGADILVNMTNDAWFEDTASPYQHMQASVLRAVENRVYVARAANTGISCVIDDAGRIVATVTDEAGKPTFVRGGLAETVHKTRRRSFYTMAGDWFVWSCVALSGAMVLWLRRQRPVGRG